MKLEELNKISNPDKVFNKFNKLKLEGTIHISDRKDKKYYVLLNNKKIHFGSTMEDYTFHKDKKRRYNFKSRNGAWKYKPEGTASFYSYYLLW
jgi:acid phosphatase class B